MHRRLFRIDASRRLGRRPDGIARGLVLVVAGFAALVPNRSTAGRADVVEATAVCTADSVCDFRVSVRHADEGWGHYANRWEVLTPEGQVLATRVLQHPHVDEQPFTRSLRDIRVPPDSKQVHVRAGDSVHGFGGQEQTIRLER